VTREKLEILEILRKADAIYLERSATPAFTDAA
jgi:hypothetical protein